VTPPVDVVLLAAGYGTRLYPLTKDRPKALLSLGRRTILDWIVETVTGVRGISQIILVTNHRFAGQFQAWKEQSHRAVEVVDDGTLTNETRLGAIRDLQLALARLNPDHDVLILGTDNLFTWSLPELVAVAQAKRPGCTIAVRYAASTEEAKRCAVVAMDREGRLTECVEKPAFPASLTVGLCIYYLPAPSRHRVQAYIDSGRNVDAPGYFIEWLVQQEPVYGFVTGGEWFDIGSPESYQEAVERWGRISQRMTQARPSTIGGQRGT